jgi:tetratricopeptide (TPR) repeat protein
MTCKERGQTAVVGSIVLLALPACVLFVLGGCAGTEATRPAVDPVGTVPSNRTEAQLLTALDQKFEDPQAHYELADLYRKSQNWNKAEYHYNVALGFEPGNKAAQAGLVKMYADRGDKARAEQFANEYIRRAAVSVADMLRLGWEFEKLDMDEYALRTFRQAVTAAPDSAEANKQIGLYYLGKNDTASAKQYLMRSFELNPRQPDVAGALGKMGVVVQSPGVPEGTLK